MRLGVVILPDRPWAEAEAAWRHAEELGFDHAWTYDHLAWRNLRNGPWFGAVPTLVAAACATSTIRLGTLVASPNFRHPVPFARELIALDDLSSGRFTLGVGAGGSGWDATILGQDEWSPRERADRFEEFVSLLDELLTSTETTRTGVHYTAEAVPMHPGCVQQPRLPFAVAATGPRGMALVARFGQGWVTNGEHRVDQQLTSADAADVVARQSERLDEICAAVGREADELDRIVLNGLQFAPCLGSAEELRDTMGRLDEVGVTDLVVHWPRESQPYAGDLDHFVSVVSEILG